MPEDGEVSPVPPKSDIIPLDVVVLGESETNGENDVDSTGSDPKVSEEPSSEPESDSERPQCNGLRDESPADCDGNMNANSVTVTENSVAENSVIVSEISGDTTSDTGNGDDATRPVVDTDSGDVVTESDVKTTETSAGEEGETKTEEDETTLDVATMDEKTGEFGVGLIATRGQWRGSVTFRGNLDPV